MSSLLARIVLFFAFKDKMHLTEAQFIHATITLLKENVNHYVCDVLAKAVVVNFRTFIYFNTNKTICV